MAQSGKKSKPPRSTVVGYLKSLSDADRETATTLLELFESTTGMKPVMWGSIVGFGTYHYRYDSGQEGNFLATGFAMRKSGPTLYIMPGYEDYSSILRDLGPHKLGKSCLYLKNLERVNVSALQKLIKTGLADLRKQYSVKKT